MSQYIAPVKDMHFVLNELTKPELSTSGRY